MTPDAAARTGFPQSATWAPDAYDPAKPMWSYDEAAWDDARQKVLEILLR